jgi:DNA-directed RNA polymerase subunit M/transcription elongation factor TFIIS
MSSYQPSQSNEEIKIIITCEKCGQKLRVPLRKKNLHVACPTCHYEFNYEFVEGSLVSDSSEQKSSPPQPNISEKASNTSSQKTETERVRCPNCGGYKITQAGISSQLLDLILMGMTFGLWLIVMLMRGPHVAKPGDKLHCELCGNEWILV